ncbi:MAG: VIT domain-containing protein [bacterium]
MLAMTTPATPDRTGSGGRLVTPDGRDLPLRHAHLTVDARGGIARAVLVQRFYNAHREALRVRYTLPMPADAAVAGFAFTLGDLRVSGEIRPRAEARAAFEQAIVQGRTAAIIEEERSTLFTQEVGNVPPGAEIVCEITVDQRLSWGEGGWTWRFPTVLGPRYLGAPGRVADADRVEIAVAATPLPARASLALTIGDALTGAVESPSHAVVCEVGEGETRVRIADEAGSRLDRDVVVRWPVAAPAVGVTISAARPAEAAHGGRTYGLLTVVPPAVAMTPRSRDLIVLIDTSGSMGGRPLDQARRIVGALIERLGPKDRVELISFGNRPERFRPEPIAATVDGKKAARKWLGKLSASGGTEMHAAVIEALRPLRSDAQRQIVLVTDGYIGFEREIIATLIASLPPDSRLHTIGVGSAPNRTLTAGAARAGRGAELCVGLGEDAEQAAASMVARTADPLVTELSIEGPGLVEQAPMKLPDLYAGTPALLGVACAAPGRLVVRGRTAEGAFEHAVEVPALALGEGEMGVAALYGRERVEDLDLRISAGEPFAALDDEIERVGVRFQVATRRTSWVAISEKVTVDPDAARRTVEQPHELPHGASIEGFGLRAGDAGGVDGGVDADDFEALAEASTGSYMAPIEEAPLGAVRGARSTMASAPGGPPPAAPMPPRAAAPMKAEESEKRRAPLREQSVSPPAAPGRARLAAPTRTEAGWIRADASTPPTLSAPEPAPRDGSAFDGGRPAPPAQGAPRDKDGIAPTLSATPSAPMQLGRDPATLEPIAVAPPVTLGVRSGDRRATEAEAGAVAPSFDHRPATDDGAAPTLGVSRIERPAAAPTLAEPAPPRSRRVTGPRSRWLWLVALLVVIALLAWWLLAPSAPADPPAVPSPAAPADGRGAP